MLTTDFSDIYTVPGSDSIIDAINPETGLTFVNGHTLEQIRERYPNAVRMTWAAWQAEQAAKQNTPITWTPITAERFNELLECLPPVGWNSRGFLVGEPWDHCLLTGKPRFQACIQKGFQCFASSRPLTIKEWREIQ